MGAMGGLPKRRKTESSSEPESSPGKPTRTYAMIKPDGMEHAKAILDRISDAGFKIIRRKVWKLPQEAAEELYASHKRPSMPGFHADLCAYVTSGKVMSLELEAPNAGVEWRRLMSPVDQRRSRIHTKHHGKPITKYICGAPQARYWYATCVDPQDPHTQQASALLCPKCRYALEKSRGEAPLCGKCQPEADKKWSLRALFGDCSDNFYHTTRKGKGFVRNALHGSDPEDAASEIALIFDRKWKKERRRRV